MRILVTGAAGSVGGAVVRGLLRRRHHLVALVTRPARAEALERLSVEIAIGNLFDDETVQRLVPTVDAVVHAAQLRLEPGPSSLLRERTVHDHDRRMMEALVTACLALKAPPTLIYTSGVWCYGDHGDQWIDETTTPRPADAARGHHDVARWLLGVHREKGLPVTVVLPGVVYGPVQSFQDWFYRPLLDGQLRLPGDGQNFWSVVHADDLGDAFALAVEQRHAGECFNIADDEPMRMIEFFSLCATSASRSAPALMPRSEALAALGAPLTESLMLSTRVCNHKARSMLGWTPRYGSCRQGIASMANHMNRGDKH